MSPSRKLSNMIALASILFVLGGATQAGAEVRYVDANASPGGTGQSWGTAFMYLQDALAIASNGDEIWVAQGTYRPDQDEAGSATPGSQTATFQLISNVAIFGGFPQGGGDWGERNPTALVTTLSGDLAIDDVPAEFPNGPSYHENSYHVTTGTGTDRSAILDGFVITSGWAEGANDVHDSGAGMINKPGSPTIGNCIFSANWARNHGCAMYNRLGSDPLVTHCTFTGNAITWEAGAIFNGESSATLEHCAFIENQAGNGGGAVWTGGGGNLAIHNCLFEGNSTPQNGGAIWVDGTDVTLTNCTLVENSAGNNGGGLYMQGTDSPTVTNCIFWSNTDDADGSSGGPYVDESAQIHGGSPQVGYSCIMGLDTFAGNGNIGDDPMFVTGSLGDNYLAQVAAGQPVDSSCVNAGTEAAANMGLHGRTTRSDEIADTALVDFGYHYSLDCNGNGIPDDQDIASGFVEDCNNDGIPDTCAEPFFSEDFEGTPGPEWSNPITAITPSGRSFLGQFDNETVVLTLESLPPHTEVSVSFDLYLINSWDGNAPYYPQYGPDFWGLRHSGNVDLLWATFSNCPDSNPQTYPDDYPGGDYPCQTGASEVDTLGYPGGEQGDYGDLVYSFPNEYHDFTFSHSDDTLQIDFVGQPNQSIPDEPWGIDNVVIRLRSDCNGNGIPDECELADNDCNTNLIPDDCEPDWDGDGIIDDCDSDDDNDGVLDEDDVCPLNTPGLSVDCEGRPRLDLNGDCNVNGLDLQLIVQELLDS